MRTVMGWVGFIIVMVGAVLMGIGGYILGKFDPDFSVDGVADDIIREVL